MQRSLNKGLFLKEALLLSLPIMGQSLIANLVNLIDNMMVAGLGDVMMSGVNMAGQLLFVLTVIMEAVCNSGGIYLTQYFGAKNKEGMKQAEMFKFVFCFVIIVLYMFICFVIPRQTLSLMVVGNNEAELILDEGIKYMRIMGFIGIPMMFSFIFSSSLREVGKVNVPLFVSLGATLINVVLNYSLIYGHFGFRRMEVKGAAIATVVARLVEMTFYYFYFLKYKHDFLVKIKDFFRINFSLFKDMFKKSLMFISSETLFVVSETITTALYNGRGGADVVSGMSASFGIANLYFVSFVGVGSATSIILGKLLGEGKLEEAKLKAKWLLEGSFYFSLIILLFGIGLSYFVPLIYPKLSLEALTICRKMVFYMALIMPVWIIQNTQFAISRAGGDTLMNMIVDGLLTIILHIPFIFYLALYTGLGPVEIYIFSKLIDLIKMLLAFLWLKKERWVVNLSEN